MAKVYDNATDLITFARSSSGTALRRVGYGDELVVDGSGNWVGDFDVAADLDEWTAGLGGSASHTGTAMELTVGASTLCKIEKPYTFSSNKLYKLTFEITSSSAGVSRVYNYSADELHNFGPGNTTGTFEHVFTGGSSTRGFDIRIEGTEGSTATIDNISVKEVIFDRATDDLVLFNHPDDIPRIEYAADGSLKGLLIEEQRTNYITSSAALNSGVDSLFGVHTGTVTNNAGTFLDGSNDAVRIDFAGVSTYLGVQKPVTSGQTYTFSFFAKPISVPGNWYMTTQGSAGGFLKNIAADLVTDEWVRVHLTFTAAATTTQQFRFVSDNEVEAYICGAQLEEGSFPTSYIPTSGSTVTRSPDIASIPVSAFGYNQDAGTVVVEFDTVGGADIGDDHYVLSGDSTNARWAYHNSADILKIYDGANAPGIILNQDDLPVKHKFAVASDASSVSTASGGSMTASNWSSTGNLPALTTAFVLGSSHADAYQLNGHLKSIQYFPRRLTDAQLQELTA